MVNHTNGFTLMELLVVVAIIAVLLAMLMPAMDKAVYQTELAVCGTKLKGIGTAATTYAAGYRRFYPYRPGSTPSGTGFRPMIITNSPATDQRPVLRQASLSINANLRDPFVDSKVDFENEKVSVAVPTTSTIYVSYSLWFSFQYPVCKPMTKLGDRLEVNGSTFDILASDDDYLGTGPAVYSSHPDGIRNNDGILVLTTQQDAAVAGLYGPSTTSFWQSYATYKRSATDLNYARTDGSVERFNAVQAEEADGGPDDRMIRIPDLNHTNDTVASWTQLPAR